MTSRTGHTTEIDVVLRPLITPREHVRTALHLLSELHERLGQAGSVTADRYYLARLLAAARRQLWLAAAAIGSGPEGSGWGAFQPTRAVPKRHWVLTIALVVAVVGARVVAFALKCAWQLTLTLLRVLLRSS
jgi:hypothetical protein